jgi:UDP-N-acetylmuramate-alanine ligase
VDSDHNDIFDSGGEALDARFGQFLRQIQQLAR